MAARRIRRKRESHFAEYESGINTRNGSIITGLAEEGAKEVTAVRVKLGEYEYTIPLEVAVYIHSLHQEVLSIYTRLPPGTLGQAADERMQFIGVGGRKPAPGSARIRREKK